MITAILVITMFATLMVGCDKEDTKTADNKGATTTNDSGSKGGNADDTTPKEIKQFTMFNAVLYVS